MDRASDAPVVASAGTQAEPRTPASWLLSAGRSQTAAPLPGGSDPAVSRRSPAVMKTGANRRSGWLSGQDSNLNRLNSNLEERAVIAARRHAAGVGLAGIRC